MQPQTQLLINAGPLSSRISQTARSASFRQLDRIVENTQMTRETRSVDGIEENAESLVSLSNHGELEQNNLAGVDSVPDFDEVNNSLKSWLNDDDCIADADEDRTYCIIEEQVELTS